MKKIKIGEGIELTDLALGETGRGNPATRERAFTVMDHYYEKGGTTFDSARVYGDGAADKALGEWIASRKIDRETIIYVSKGSHPPLGQMHISRISKEEMMRDLDESLAFSGQSYSDVHMLHRDDLSLPVEDIMPWLDALVQSGKTRAIGVSNWTVGRIIQANEFALANGLEPIRCSQMHFSLAQTTPAMSGDQTHVMMNDIELSWYRESQLPVMCFGAQARGWFAARAQGKDPKAGAIRYYDTLPENHRRLIRAKKLAEKLGKPLPAITSAYVRDRGIRSIVLSSFSSTQQLDEVLAMDSFRLSAEQIKYLETGVGTC